MKQVTTTRIIAHRYPDEGWAWVVAFSCCFINAVIFGIYRTYGVIFVALLNTYDVSRETASWPFSLCLTVFHMTGLVSGALSTYFTTRSICIVGCFVAALGISLCYFTTSIFQVAILIGLVKGFGMGLVGTQTPVIINQYFDRYRATASGIALAGGTIGSFIFPPLVKYIIVEYSLRGAFLILGGIIVNTIPVALLLRPPVPKLPNDSSVEAESATSHSSNNSLAVISPSSATVVHMKECSTHEETSVNTRHTTTGDTTSPCSQQAQATLSPSNDTRDTLLCKMCRLSNSFVTALASNVKLIQLLLRNPHFLILCCTQISFTWGWTTFVMVVVDFAVDRGIEISMAVVLLSAFAAADLCGRLGSGWISDKGILKRKTVASSAITLIGILLLIIPLSSSYTTLFIISLLLGLFSGSIMILFSILLVEYVGIEIMPVALGTSTFTCGMATMLRPAVIGFFRDVNNSYDGLFSFLATLALLSSILWFIEPCIKFCSRSTTSFTLTKGTDSKRVSSVVAIN